MDDEETKIDDYHMHEVLDRAHICREMWDNYIIEHPAVATNPELEARAAYIGTLIGNFYQRVGEMHLVEK